MDAAPFPDPNLGRSLADSYRIDALLGEGGMGVVYRGTQLSVNRAVAIKLLNACGPRSRAERERRFRREAEATARLNHPNTVRLYDFGVSEVGEPFMVMELLSGTDLEQHLVNVKRLAWTEAVHITRQILYALSEAHALGIVHRDLKTSNVFLSIGHGGDLSVKVMDFGIAGIVLEGSTRLTQSGMVLGSPPYISPEQAQGRDVDQRADLYAVGVMLFEMLTGELPIEANSLHGYLLAHVSNPPRRLADLAPELEHSDAFQRLFDRLLAKEPDHRSANAREVLEALEALEARGTRQRVAVSEPSLPAAQLAIPSPRTTLTPTSLGIRPRRYRWMLGGILMCAALLAVLALTYSFTGRGTPPRPERAANMLKAAPVFTPRADVAAGPEIREHASDALPTGASAPAEPIAATKSSEPRPLKDALQPQAAVAVEATTVDAKPARFSVAADDTVYDTRTKLTWQRQASPHRYTQVDSKRYCARLPGTAPWRLPTLQELESLVDKHFSPAIDPAAFPNTPPDFFWSSTPHEAARGDGWFLYFLNGSASYYASGGLNRVRCTR